LAYAECLTTEIALKRALMQQKKGYKLSKNLNHFQGEAFRLINELESGK